MRIILRLDGKIVIPGTKEEEIEWQNRTTGHDATSKFNSGLFRIHVRSGPKTNSADVYIEGTMYF